MPKKNKRAFDKKNSVTYRLVPAEKTDDENAPKHIFVPVPKGGKKVPFPFGESLGLTDGCLPVPINAPVASKSEDAEIDPEIQAVLEDDFEIDPEDTLEDDFIAKATSKENGAFTSYVVRDGSHDSGDFDEDDDENRHMDTNIIASSSKIVTGEPVTKKSCYSLPELDHERNIKLLQEKFGKMLDAFDAEQESESAKQTSGKSHVMEKFLSSVTEPNSNTLFDSDISDDESLDLHSYAQSSSSKPGGDGHTERSVMDEKLEKMLGEYEPDQIGALDFEPLDDSTCGDDLLANMLQDFKEKKLKDEENENIVLGSCDDEMKKKILNYASKEKKEEFVEIVTEKPPEFDCESILSTYSSIYNHPTVIKTDNIISTKLRKQKLTKRNLKQLEDTTIPEVSDDEASEIKSSLNISRPKNETPEERRLRKKMVKEAQRENRAIKKENKIAFKEEKRKQSLQQINQQRNAGIRII